ncbi:DUF5003 domain-containing protein [Bacteroides congonensis]
MKDIMKYYLQLIVLAFCLFTSACSDDDETVTPVFPDLQKIECEVGDARTLTFKATDNWILTSSSLWCYFEQNGEHTFTCSGGAGEQTITIHISDDATELMKSYKAELTMTMAGSRQVIAEVTRPSMGYEVRAFNADKSVVYTEENPFVINFDGTDILVLDANEDWVLKDKPEWMEFKRKASDSEIISGRSGDNVKVTPQMIVQYKKNEITGFLTTESRSGAIAKVPVKYEGIPADRIIGTLTDNIEASADGESYTVGDNSYSSEGVPVTVMAKNDEYTLVCVEYVEELNMLTYQYEYSYTIMENASNRWLWIDDDDKGNINIAASSNSSEKRNAYVLAFSNSVYAEIKDQLSDLVLLKTGIPQAYNENIIANVLQAEDASASMGFVLKNGDGEVLTNVTLTSYVENVGEEQAMEKYGTKNVWIASLPLGISFDPLVIAPKGITMTHYLMAVNFIDDYKWNGIEKEEPFMDVTIHGIGSDVNGEKDMELSFMDSSGEIYAVLIISKRYAD